MMPRCYSLLVTGLVCLGVSSAAAQTPVGSSVGWKTLSDSPIQPRSNFGTGTTKDGAAFVMGGISSTGQTLFDIWTWTQTGWVEQTRQDLDPNPTGRELPGVTTLQDGSILVFGGGRREYKGSSEVEVVNNETWLWNGTVWAQKTPAHPNPSPKARMGALLATLPNGNVLLHGGFSTEVEFDDTWLWETKNGSWVDITSSSGDVPPKRGGAGKMLTTAKGTVLMFGGLSGGTFLNDTWEWTSTSGWTKLQPAASPEARSDFAFSRVPGSDDLLLFGGLKADGVFRDAWTWNGTTWTQKTFSGTLPQGRAYAGMTIHGDTLLLFGGATSKKAGPGIKPSTTLDGAWILNLTTSTWKQSTKKQPTRRYYTPIVATGANELLVFGGIDGYSNVYGDTWKWDGSTWIDMDPETGPQKRLHHAMARLTNGDVILYGGYKNLDSARYGDMWKWDGENWDLLTPAHDPGPRQMAGLVALPNGRALLWGGENWNEELKTVQGYSQTWLWSGTDWTRWNPEATVKPAQFKEFAITALNDGRVLLFGGKELVPSPTGGNATIVNSDKTWLWDETNGWSQLNISGPPASHGATMTTLANGRVLLFGGVSEDGLKDGVWEFDGSAWRALTVVNPVVARWQHSMTSFGDHAFVFGGARNLVASVMGDLLSLAYQGPAGTACTSTAECLSGFCVDGVCCASACNEGCGVCSIAKGATADGTCTAAVSGTTCHAASCEEGRSIAAATCDGSALACAVVRTDCANNMACDGAACRTAACAAPTHCRSGFRCEAGACVAQIALGGACASSEACVSGACVEGRCCDGFCSGVCEVCSETGACVAAAAGEIGRCDTSDTCAGICDGVATRDCLKFPGEEKLCGATVCEDGGQAHYTCNGAGMCSGLTASTPCTPYICGESACRTECAIDADCVGDTLCVESACVAPPPAPKDDSDSGCGCSSMPGGAPGGASGTASALALILLSLTTVSARRRRV